MDNANIYFGLIDSLKSPNAKKLLVIHFSSTNSYGSAKKYFRSLFISMSFINALSFTNSSGLSPDTNANTFYFLDLLNTFSMMMLLDLVYSIKASSEAKNMNLCNFYALNLSFFKIFNKKFSLI